MYCTVALVSTVTTLGSSTSASSFGPGTVPVDHIVGSPQLPLLVAVMSTARPVTAKSKRDKLTKAGTSRLVFIERFYSSFLVGTYLSMGDYCVCRRAVSRMKR